MNYRRIFYFILVFMSALFLPVWIFGPLAVIYALAFSGYELLVIALLVDAQFGDTSRTLWYGYTLMVSVILLAAVAAKPYLKFYP